jgi:hypothetical protein
MRVERSGVPSVTAVDSTDPAGKRAAADKRGTPWPGLAGTPVTTWMMVAPTLPSTSARSHMGMEMGKSGMAHGDAMHDMHAHMQALHDHSKMMEGITDQKQLAEEMKKHMRMLDEMMEKMMQRHMESTSGEEPKS